MYNPIDSNAMEMIERSTRRNKARPVEQTDLVHRPATIETWPVAPRPGPVVTFDLPTTLRWLARRRLLIALLAILGAAAGAAFVSLSIPTYTVTTDVLVDPSNLRVMSNDLFTESQQRDTQLLDAESKLRILTSGNVLARVVADLKLAEDPEFAGDQSSLSVTQLLGLAKPPEKGDPALGALRALAKRVKAIREERSFVVTVSVWTEEAAKSVRIASALVTAFQAELAKAEADDAARTAAGLSDRLDGLRTSAEAADQAVEAFKREHGLQSSSGELVSTHIADQINAKVVDAQNRVILAESRYNQLTAADADGALNANGLQSDTMTELRARDALVKSQVESQSAVLAQNHPTLIALKAQLQTIERQITDETARMVQRAKTELDEARASLASLESEAGRMKTTVFVDKQAQAELRQLERDAEAKAAIYQTFLTRERQVSEREQLNTTNVRVISPPLPPQWRSWPPRMVMVMAAGLSLGLALGGMLAIGLGAIGDLRVAGRARPRAA
jgi:uncharacterized protein involved in exopolysaccharide biosynthesis